MYEIRKEKSNHIIYRVDNFTDARNIARIYLDDEGETDEIVKIERVVTTETRHIVGRLVK